MNNWITKVKQLLNEHGLTYAWDNAHMLCHEQFISLFKQRVTDCFLQKLFSDVNSYSVLDSLYKHVKQYFEIEFYICNIGSRRVRVALTKLRVSSHVLRIESGRYGRDRIKKAERKCFYCTNNDFIL